MLLIEVEAVVVNSNDKELQDENKDDLQGSELKLRLNFNSIFPEEGL